MQARSAAGRAIVAEVETGVAPAKSYERTIKIRKATIETRIGVRFGLHPETALEAAAVAGHAAVVVALCAGAEASVGPFGACVCRADATVPHGLLKAKAQALADVLSPSLSTLT